MDLMVVLVRLIHVHKVGTPILRWLGISLDKIALDPDLCQYIYISETELALTGGQLMLVSKGPYIAHVIYFSSFSSVYSDLFDRIL